MKIIAILFCCLVMLFFGCIDSSQQQPSNATNASLPSNTTIPDSGKNATIPNPAAVYCVNMNYSYTIKNTSAGQAGYCSKAKSECDEWKLFRQECCLQDADCALKNCTDGAAYCSSQGCYCPIIQKNNSKGNFPPKTNKTIDQLLDSGLESSDSEIISTNAVGSSYTTTSSKWILTVTGLTQPPDEIPLGSVVMPSHVFFNNKTEDGLRGFAFKTYTPDSGAYKPVTMGLAIFLNEPSLMQKSLASATLFNITYKPAQSSKTLEKCEVQNKQIWEMQSNKTVYSYFFKCAITVNW
jgi:putative hemolysin